MAEIGRQVREIEIVEEPVEREFEEQKETPLEKEEVEREEVEV